MRKGYCIVILMAALVLSSCSKTGVSPSETPESSPRQTEYSPLPSNAPINTPEASPDPVKFTPGPSNTPAKTPEASKRPSGTPPGPTAALSKEATSPFLIYNIEDLNINEELVSLIGMDVSLVVEKLGEITEADWWSGPIFRHENSDFWCCYSKVEEDFSKPYGEGFAVSYRAVLLEIKWCRVADIFPDTNISEKDFDASLKIEQMHDGVDMQCIEYGDVIIGIEYNDDGVTIDGNSFARIYLKPELWGETDEIDDSLDEDYQNPFLNLEIDDLNLNEELFSLLGATGKEIIEKYGEIIETEWYDGPLFKHENCDLWFAYSKLDNSYNVTDESVLFAIRGCRVSDIFPDMDISEKDFDENLINEYEGDYYQYIVFDGFEIEIYYSNDGTIDENSYAEVWLASPEK